MTWYVMNNKVILKLNLLTPKPVCKELSNDIRLQQDLVFFNKLYSKLEKKYGIKFT